MFERAFDRFATFVGQKFLQFCVHKVQSDLACRNAVKSELGLDDKELDDMLTAMVQDAHPY